ncbi:MAG: carbohydrate esterase family 4 protein [Acidomyces sp. 'richmondensis']|nr:MAG: carbohydrate esterase family 4 protein [Acidomyces sp. 'richmondensis']
MPEGYFAHPDYGYARDFRGYGEAGLPALKWPDNAKIAIFFVINYEEGGERSVLNGDGVSETHLRKNPAGGPRSKERKNNVESEYEYGSHAGFWPLFRMFNKNNIKFTLYAVAQAIEQLPKVAIRSVEMGHDVASHAYRWVYDELGEELVWATDSYADDVPYWVDPSYDCSDFKFHTAGSGFRDPTGSYTHLKNAFDVLYEDGQEGCVKMMTVGLNCCIIGRPGRFKALQDFVEYILTKKSVWVATRTQIAETFRERFPYQRGHLVKSR